MNFMIEKLEGLGNKYSPMDYTKIPYDTVLQIDLSKINTEQALFLATFLKGKQRTALHMFFKNTLLYINREKNEERKKRLIEAHPYLMKLIHIADKFNQRDGWWLEDQCVLTHDKVPHNNLGSIVTVNKNEIKIITRKNYNKYFLEFATGGKHEGNLEYFIETYKEDILKAAPFLIAY
jgi:hypothetical protein